MKNRRLFAKLVASGIVWTVTLAWISATATLAAYENKHRHEVILNVTSDFAGYFGGGVGSKPNPYLLTSEEHVKNLEALVRLGVFDTNAYFMLGADITFTKPLSPIGTENNPFISNFDGNGKKLYNVAVTSTDYDDVGFFGYVGSGGTVRNILFDSVSITSTGPETAVSNPFENMFVKEDGTNLLLNNGTTGPLALTFSNATTSSPTLNIPLDQRIADKNGHYYDVFFRSNEPTVLKDDGTLVDQVTTLPATTFYTTMDAIVYDTYYDHGTGQIQFVTYTIQRYQIWISRAEGGKLSFMKNTKVNNTDTAVPIATMNNEDNSLNVHYYSEDPSNSAAFVTTPQPVVYTGLVIGHLDGKANNIGVAKGTITSNTRQQLSFSTLVGKTTNDTNLLENKSKTYFQDLDLNDIITKMNYPVGKTYAATTTSGSNRTNDPITDFNNSAVQSSGATGITDTDAMKIFGATKVVQNNVYVPYLDENENEVYPDTTTPLGGLNFDSDLTYKTTTSQFIGSYNSGVQINNGFFFWASMNVESIGFFMNLIKLLFGSDYSFNINVELSYSVDNCEAALANSSYFQVWENKMSVKRQSITGFLGNIVNDPWVNSLEKADDKGIIPPIANVCPSTTDSNKLLKYKFTTKSDSVSAYYGTDNKTLATPLYALGLGNSSPDGSTETTSVNVYGIKFSLTSANGNTNNNLDDIDFIRNTDITYSGSDGSWNSGRWDNWPTYSNAYIYFWMVKFEKSTTEKVDDADLVTGLTYTVTRSSDSVISGARISVVYTCTVDYFIPGDTNNIATITSSA